MLKKYFLTGIVILLPFVLTIFLVIFVINLLARPLQSLVESVLSYYHLLNGSFFIFTGDQVLHQVSKLIALMTLFFILIFVGFIARLVFVKYFLKLADLILYRIPIVNKIYKAVQELVRTLFSSKSSSFRQVVLVPFPDDRILCIGLLPEYTVSSQEEEVVVFIPGTPNPTGGFLLKFKKNKLIYTEMKVEEALKFVISCGVFQPNFSISPIKS